MIPKMQVVTVQVCLQTTPAQMSAIHCSQSAVQKGPNMFKAVGRWLNLLPKHREWQGNKNGCQFSLIPG